MDTKSRLVQELAKKSQVASHDVTKVLDALRADVPLGLAESAFGKDVMSSLSVDNLKLAVRAAPSRIIV